MKQLLFAAIISIAVFSCGKDSQAVNQKDQIKEEISTSMDAGMCTATGNNGVACGDPVCNGSTNRCCSHCTDCPPPPPPPCPNPPCN